MIAAVTGLVFFTVFMVIAHKRRMSQSVYIPICLAAGASGSGLCAKIYSYYVGAYNLYFFIVVALVIGLIIDFIIRKTVVQKPSA